MKLEEEISQKQFRSEHQKLAVNIFYTHGWLMNNYNKVFKKFNLTANQFNILRILRGQYPNSASVNLLKQRMLDKMSDASRLVERLRAKGLVKRNICPNDRRKVDVVITEKGLNLLSDIDKFDNHFDEILGKISEPEAKQLNLLLDKIRD
jgi:DNA-binding MarR family transcriptional regulator